MELRQNPHQNHVSYHIPQVISYNPNDMQVLN